MECSEVCHNPLQLFCYQNKASSFTLKDCGLNFVPMTHSREELAMHILLVELVKGRLVKILPLTIIEPRRIASQVQRSSQLSYRDQLTNFKQKLLRYKLCRKKPNTEASDMRLRM